MILNFSNIVDKISDKKRIDGQNINELLDEVNKSLLQADVHPGVVGDFINSLKGSLTIDMKPSQVIKILKGRFIKYLSISTDLDLNSSSEIRILLCGLQGSGKTTFASKLSFYLKENYDRKVILSSVDYSRPKGIDQLKILANKGGIEFYEPDKSKYKDTIKGLDKYIKKDSNLNTSILDTAGRTGFDQELCDELADIIERYKPTHIIYVVNATVGRSAINTALKFSNTIKFNSVAVTNTDSDTRGGILFSIPYIMRIPISFTSSGEDLYSIDLFHPDRFVSRILGFGDLETLNERASIIFKDDDKENIKNKIEKGSFTFNDFIKYIEMLKKLGPMAKVLGMIPGINKMNIQTDALDREIKNIKIIVSSMTNRERDGVDTLNRSRIVRISKGSGVSYSEVDRTVDKFRQLNAMFKQAGSLDKLKDMFGGALNNE